LTGRIAQKKPFRRPRLGLIRFSHNLGSTSLQYQVNKMIAWPKLIGSAKFLLPLVIAVSSDCCHCENSLPPTIDTMSPNIGTQGTDVVVTMTGSFSNPLVVIDGKIGGVIGEVSTDFSTPYPGGTSITVTFHIGPNAHVGRHFVSVFMQDIGLGSEPQDFAVICPGCPPPPELVNVTNPSGDSLVTGGPPVTAKIVGTNLSRPSAQLRIDPTGISFPPGPYNVQNDGTYDYFLVPLTAAANAPTGLHYVRVITDGGTSDAVELNLISSQPANTPTPGATPYLKSVTPVHITMNSIAPVYIKLSGNGFCGFSIYREVVVDQFLYPLEGSWTYQSNLDQVVVVAVSTYGLSQPGPALMMRVHNLTNDTYSDSLPVFLDGIRPGAPYVTNVSGAVFLGGDVDAFISGENLDGITAQSFSGIPGLTFSNVHSDPNYPADQGFWVHVHADMNAPVTGDEATNLTITTLHGQSNLFGFAVGRP